MTNVELIELRKLHKPTNGEREIARFLRHNRIIFKREYFDPTLISPFTKSLLFIDFYLPKLRIAIEFDGPGHYAPVYGVVQLSKTRRHDEIKNRWCKHNKIRMLRISAWRRRDIENRLIKAIY